MFLQLKQTSPEDVSSLAHALGWALRVLQAERSTPAEFAASFRSAWAELEKLPENESARWLRIG